MWFFHAIHRYVRATADTKTLRALIPILVDIVQHHLRGHAVRHRRRSGGRPAAAGRRGLSADVDGCEGRRLGRHAAARQGGRDQRAVVQRALPARRLDARARRRRGTRSRRPCGPGPRRRSTRDSGMRTAAICTTSSTVNTATTRRAGRTRCSRSRWIIRCSTTDALGGRDGRRADPVADAGRPALAGAGLAGLQGEVLRRPALARRRLSSGHRLGLADRAVRRRLAEAAPATTAPARVGCSTGSRRISTRRASARSARSSTPTRRTLHAGASRRRGASPRCSGSSRRRRRPAMRHRVRARTVSRQRRPAA